MDVHEDFRTSSASSNKHHVSDGAFPYRPVPSDPGLPGRVSSCIARPSFLFKYLKSAIYNLLQYASFATPAGSTIPEKLRQELKAELVSLSESGLPYVGFLLQHEYTISGLLREVSYFETAPSLFSRLQTLARPAKAFVQTPAFVVLYLKHVPSGFAKVYSQLKPESMKESGMPGFSLHERKFAES